MARKPRNTPKYFSLEPDAFLSDHDFQIMSAEERGVYWTIILYLYRNNGRLKYDESKLRKLCNVNDDFDFQSVLIKFDFRRGFVRHKRVSKEIQKAQVLVNRAVKAANTRWEKGSLSNAQASSKQCQAKRSEVKLSNNNTKQGLNKSTLMSGDIQAAQKRIRNKISSHSDSLRFAEKLEKILPPLSRSDKTAYVNMIHWAAESQKIDPDIFVKILDYAKQAKTGRPRNKIAVFFSLLRKNLDYQGKG